MHLRATGRHAERPQLRWRHGPHSLLRAAPNWSRRALRSLTHSLNRSVRHTARLRQKRSPSLCTTSHVKNINLAKAPRKRRRGYVNRLMRQRKTRGIKDTRLLAHTETILPFMPADATWQPSPRAANSAASFSPSFLRRLNCLRTAPAARHSSSLTTHSQSLTRSVETTWWNDLLHSRKRSSPQRR